jgi:hypothetical protein
VEFISAPVGGQKTPTKVLSKQYKARRRRRLVTCMMAAVAVGIALSFVLVNVPWDPSPRRAIADASPASPDAGSVARTAPVAVSVRPVYRHSVVPGGVRSPGEVENVIQRDQVVAAHYKGINPQLLRNERLQKPLLAHVSYRLGDKVYWTKNRVQLPANEPVMTDGTATIRERCGNLISMEPLAPVSEEEPALPSFDLLMDPMQFAWMRLDYTPPALRRGTPAPGKPALYSAPFSYPGAGGTPGFRSSKQPGEPSARSIDPPDEVVPTVETPLPVPEPNTLTLFGLAGAAGVAHYLRKRAQARARS